MKILMVCLGNICRSPVAEGILKHKAAIHSIKISVDSAGTSGWHNGSAPDERSQKNAKKNGVIISQQKSRQVTLSDFEEFDLIYAMDNSNYDDLKKLAPSKHKGKIKLILDEIYPGKNANVPDPYYTTDGFDEVFNLLDAACEKIILNIKSKSKND